METIKSKIEEYNAAVDEVLGDDYYLLSTFEPASDSDLEQLKQHVGFELPKELIQFYKTFGGLKNIDNEESYCFSISTISTTRDLGLIEMIRYSWGFDRYEFDEGENFTAEEIKQLNSNYKCIGWYRDDTVCESAYYIFFDKDGNFGELFYDQDCFNDAYKVLKKLLKNEFEKTTLENILVKALEQTKDTLIMWNE